MENTERKENKKSGILSLVYILVVLILLVSWGAHKLGPKINKSWAIEVACTEVTSAVYNEFGEIPEVSGKLIYHDDADYIVAVNYMVPAWGLEGSRACHVYGYRENNCFVSGMTKDMSYGYDFSPRLNELKAMWALK